jgi:hypothetical protein
MGTDTLCLMKISLGSFKRVGGVGILGSILEAFKKERNSRSVWSWIFVRFRIIVLELMVMLMLAVWRAEKGTSNRLIWVSLLSFYLLINFLSLGIFFLLRHEFSSWLDRASDVFVLDCLHKNKRFLD